LAIFSKAGLDKARGQSTLVDLINKQSVPKGLEAYASIFKENTIVYFGAKWCPSCPAQRAILEILEMQGFRIKYFDADKHRELYLYFRGEAIPLTIIFVKGKVKTRFVGITSIGKIKREAGECIIQ
jgi:thiol-disulfide isomerase/thioredoxin